MNLADYLSRERGRAARLAKALQVSGANVSQMASGARKVSPETAVAIERFSGGMVTRRDLRPGDWREIWPELAEAQ